jgi:hypothetical protein
MNTRGLQSMTAARIADISCQVFYNHSTPQDDGSSLNAIETIDTMASVVPLRPQEILRLLEGGIIVRNGVSIVLTNVPNRRPDKIIADSKSWRILDWTFVYAYDDIDEYDEYMEEFGTIVATCDEITIEGV